MPADRKRVFVFQMEANIGGLTETKQKPLVDGGKIDVGLGN